MGMAVMWLWGPHYVHSLTPDASEKVGVRLHGPQLLHDFPAVTGEKSTCCFTIKFVGACCAILDDDLWVSPMYNHP